MCIYRVYYIYKKHKKKKKKKKMKMNKNAKMNQNTKKKKKKKKMNKNTEKKKKKKEKKMNKNTKRKEIEGRRMRMIMILIIKQYNICKGPWRETPHLFRQDLPSSRTPHLRPHKWSAKRPIRRRRAKFLPSNAGPAGGPLEFEPWKPIKWRHDGSKPWYPFFVHIKIAGIYGCSSH